MNQRVHVLQRIFSNRDNIRASIQFRGERQSQHHYFNKHYLGSRADPSIFESIVSVLQTVQINQTQFFQDGNQQSPSCPNLQCPKVRFKFRSQLQLLQQISYLVTLTVDNSIISLNSNITDGIIINVINLQQEKSRLKNRPLTLICMKYFCNVTA